MQEEAANRLVEWMDRCQLLIDSTTLVVKPADGGSSLHVSVHQGMQEAVLAARELFEYGITTEAVIEPKVLGGIEFSVVVLETANGPIALTPTTIEIVDYTDDIDEYERTLEVERRNGVGDISQSIELVADENSDSLYTFRHKYTPSSAIRTHTPPRAPAEIVQARPHH